MFSDHACQALLWHPALNGGCLRLKVKICRFLLALPVSVNIAFVSDTGCYFKRINPLYSDSCVVLLISYFSRYFEK